jgi:hypothetical protein
VRAPTEETAFQGACVLLPEYAALSGMPRTLALAVDISACDKKKAMPLPKTGAGEVKQRRRMHESNANRFEFSAVASALQKKYNLREPRVAEDFQTANESRVCLPQDQAWPLPWFNQPT